MHRSVGRLSGMAKRFIASQQRKMKNFLLRRVKMCFFHSQTDASLRHFFMEACGNADTALLRRTNPGAVRLAF